jgi:integrase
MKMDEFFEKMFVPNAELRLSAATVRFYKATWKYYLNPYCGDRYIRSIKTYDVQYILQELARTQPDLAHSVFRQAKVTLSALFKVARRLGVIDFANPVQDAAIPEGKETEDTYAYSLDEIVKMIMLIPEPIKYVIATAAFTGLSKSEVWALQCGDYSGDELRVSRSYWNGKIGKTKTRERRAAVPVIAPLHQLLDRMLQKRAEAGASNASETALFRNTWRKSRLNIDNYTRRVVIPKLQKAAVDWHGWHAFRRGLATNLHSLGIDDKTIQKILRHANVSTTQKHYVKTVPSDALAAMKKLEGLVKFETTEEGLKQ